METIKLELSPSIVNWIIRELDYCGHLKEIGTPKQNPHNDFSITNEIQKQAKEQGHKCLISRSPDVEREPIIREEQ